MLFRRLAVFVGGFTLEAAEAVASGPGEPGIDPFEGVASLLDKSLLRQEARPGRGAALHDAGDGARVRARAVSSERRGRRDPATPRILVSGTDGGGRASILRRAGPRLPGWPVWTPSSTTCVPPLPGSMRQTNPPTCCGCWRALGTGPSGPTTPRSVAGWSRRCAPPPTLPLPFAWRHSSLLPMTTSFLGDGPAAVAYAEEGLALARELGDPFALGRALYAVGVAWAFSGDVARAAVPYEEAVSLLRTTGVTSWEAMALAELGDTRLMTGDVAGAVPLLDEALALHRRVENPFGIRGDPRRTRARRADAGRPGPGRPPVRREHRGGGGDRHLSRLLLGAVAGLAGVALALGQPERAARLLGAVETEGETSGVGRLGHAAHTARILAEVRTSLPEPVFAAAWEEGRALPFADALADALAIAASAGQPPSPVHRRRQRLRPDAARTRRAAPAGRGPLRSGDRRGALHRRAHRADPRRQPLRQARRQRPRRGGGRRGAPGLV